MQSPVNEQQWRCSVVLPKYLVFARTRTLSSGGSVFLVLMMIIHEARETRPGAHSVVWRPELLGQPLSDYALQELRAASW